MIVFTNGCFDILHPGHIDLLERARKLGSKLIVGINSDDSVRSIKGADRPFVNQEERKAVLLGLRSVDKVVIFDELTPENTINKIRPDVLVKGGDWARSEIIGADLVESYGGQVYSLPLLEGFSSSNIVDKIRGVTTRETRLFGTTISNSLIQHIDVFTYLTDRCEDAIRQCADVILETVRNRKKVLLCGNGGSAADAQHIAAEFVGRYETERMSLPAIALTTDTSALTAITNDYSFERVFARQIEGLAAPGDCLIAISTSGNSPNVIAAVMSARQRGCKVVGLTGVKGKKLASLCDACVMVPSERTARIQEGHGAIGHIWCELVDEMIEKEGFPA